MAVEPARPEDAVEASRLADEKRREYAAYSPVFWRVADNALEVHEPWLAKCISDTDANTSLTWREGKDLRGIVIAAHSVFPPPFRFDAERSWLVDDFFVATADDWNGIGGKLLDAVEGVARDQGAERLVVLCARKDEPKRMMLADRGYERGASWWVKPVEASPRGLPDLEETEAVTGPAPPVYDPGGITALALRMPDPAEVGPFTEWAAASNAVLAIVPARSTEPALEAALEGASYEPASDWWTKPV